jgi:mono/diheme cytochrome c family protein
LDGYKSMDAYSPFPVHGIDPAIGIKRTMLPFIVLIVGLTGLAIGLGMQWYTNKADWSPIFPGYAFKISGKPYFSLPANIPVTFEVIVLSSAFATFFGMWILNKLPMLSNPLHRVSRFKRVTNDKFFLMIDTKDDKFDATKTQAQLNEWGAVAIEEVRQDLTDSKLPSWLKLAGVLAAILLLLPPVAIFRAQGMTNRQPRLHFMPDMDWQEKGKTQALSPLMANGERLFADERVMRQPVTGSIARGRLENDTEMFRGIKQDWKPDVAVTGSKSARVSTSQDEAGNEGNDQGADGGDTAAEAESEDLSMYVTEFPKGVEVSEDSLARGQQRFNIYCSACHGYAGNGDGLVNARAVALNLNGKASWTSAKSLHDPVLKDAEKNPVGRIFETITAGRGTMGPYGDQIPAADRWLIVAYVKALQETGIKPPVAEATEEVEAK